MLLTILVIIAESSSDTTATGPMAISRELPITAYINGGTTLVSETKRENTHKLSTTRN